jgi:hypothetical protein
MSEFNIYIKRTEIGRNYMYRIVVLWKSFIAGTSTIYSVNISLLHRVTHRTDPLETNVKLKRAALHYLQIQQRN